MQSYLLLISGKVQGIGFRYSAQNLAKQFSLTGYAKNLPDKKVEILIQGSQEDIDNFLSRLNSIPLARISQIKKEKTQPQNREDFQTL